MTQFLPISDDSWVVYFDEDSFLRFEVFQTRACYLVCNSFGVIVLCAFWVLLEPIVVSISFLIFE